MKKILKYSIFLESKKFDPRSLIEFFEDICSEAGVALPTDWRGSIKSYQLYE